MTGPRLAAIVVCTCYLAWMFSDWDDWERTSLKIQTAILSAGCFHTIWRLLFDWDPEDFE